MNLAISKITREALENILSRFGTPLTLVLDNGKQLVSKEF